MSILASLARGSAVAYQYLNALRDRAWQGDPVFYGGTLTSAGTGYASHLESERYFDSVAATFTAYFEANLKAGAGGTIYAQLYNITDAGVVASSEISSTSDAAFERKRTAVVVTLIKNKAYCVQTKHVTAAGSIAMARLIII